MKIIETKQATRGAINDTYYYFDDLKNNSNICMLLKSLIKEGYVIENTKLRYISDHADLRDYEEIENSGLLFETLSKINLSEIDSIDINMKRNDIKALGTVFPNTNVLKFSTLKKKEIQKINDNIKYYLRKNGGIVRLTNDVTVHSLDLNGEWIPNQYLISMFIDGMDDYKEITEDEVNNVMESLKNKETEIRRTR